MRARKNSLLGWMTAGFAVVSCSSPEDGQGKSDLSASSEVPGPADPTPQGPSSTGTVPATETTPSASEPAPPGPADPPAPGNGGAPAVGGGGSGASGVPGMGGQGGMGPVLGGAAGEMNAAAGVGGGPTDGGTGGTGPAAGGAAAGAPAGGGSGGAGDGEDPFGPDIDGACTESQPANSNASGSGPHEVIVETNSDPGIREGTIFRPADLGGGELYPIFVWGQGACSQNGFSASASMAEIASHGYFVVADGTPNGDGSRPMNSDDIPSMGEPLLAYVTWAIAENAKPCSAYYHSLDASKVSANGFSCGGLMSTGTAGDPRMTTWGSTSSGTFSNDRALYDSIHTPVLIIEGGESDIAYPNGQRDYENISALGHPIMFFSKDIGHGGDLFQGRGGDFTRINLAWLNWWLKGDEGATGKGVLVGAGCTYCTDPAWEVKSANLP